MPQLEAGSIDAVITDPPYGVGKAEWDDSFPTDWIPTAWRLSEKMLVMPGNSELPSAAQAIGEYKDLIILHSRNGMTRSKIAFGNYIPVLACGNWGWVARPNHISFNVSISEKIDHPSPKPLEAMIKLIIAYTNPGDTILDPFMGSGTTGVACIQTGRNFIGIEKERKYFEISERRIAAAQPPLFVEQPAAPAPQEQQAVMI